VEALVEAGWARTPITPPIGTALAGYYVAEGRRTGSRLLHDDLHAKALAFRHDGVRGAVITTDLIGIPAALAAAVRAEVTERTGIPDSHVLVSASHNHSGPVLSPLARPDLLAGGVDQAYLDSLTRYLAGIVVAAADDMRSVTYAAGVGTCAINVNRRQRRTDGSWSGLPFLGQNWDGPVDRTVTVLRFDRDDGQRAIVINYPCHAVVLGPNVEISADYPGETQRFVEASLGPGTVAMFTNGAEGNINPIVHPGPFSESDRLGRILGAEVVKVAEELRPRPVQKVAVSRRTLDLPVADTPPLDEEARNLVEWEARCRQLRQAAGPDVVLDEEMAWTTALLRHLRRKRFGAQIEVEVQAIAVDGTVLISVPGELFTELGRQVQAASPFDQTVLVGLANDSIGYIPPRACFAEGGFEVEACPLKPGAGELLRDALIEETHQILQRR
jgi:hypothetical protein